MINIFIYVIRYVCVDDDFEQDILQGRCLVYSFGLANDWTFEEALAEMGCRVWAYDPTTTDRNVSKNISSRVLRDSTSRSVGPSVRPSVTLYNFRVFAFFGLTNPTQIIK